MKELKKKIYKNMNRITSSFKKINKQILGLLSWLRMYIFFTIHLYSYSTLPFLILPALVLFETQKESRVYY